MEYFRKVIALILSAFLLLSISGVKVHFHYCGHSQSLFADFHIINKDQINECICNVEETGCYSSNDCNTHSELCFDFVKEVRTDQDYQLSEYNPDFQAKETQLFLVSNYFFSNDDIGSFIPNHSNFHSPPKPEILSVFLI